MLTALGHRYTANWHLEQALLENPSELGDAQLALLDAGLSADIEASCFTIGDVEGEHLRIVTA